MTTTNIHVSIDEYGDDEMNGIDVEATQDRFAEKVEAAVKSSYPNAAIKIERKNTSRGVRVWVNTEEADEYGDDDAQVAQSILEKINRISENISDWAIGAAE